MAMGSWKKEPVVAERVMEWIRTGIALNQALITGFERRYGGGKVCSGSYPEDEGKFFTTANILLQTLLAAQQFIGSRYKIEELVPFSPFLDWVLGSTKGCFDDWSKLDWVDVTWEEGRLMLEVWELEVPDMILLKGSDCPRGRA